VLVDQLFDEKLFGEDQKAAAIIGKAIELAVSGDAACMRLCLDRIAAPRKDRPVHFEFPKIKEAKDAVSATAAIANAVARGELTPSEAAELSKVVESYARALQSVEFESRLSNLERAVERDPGGVSRV
jgi:hypothetical protein